MPSLLSVALLIVLHEHFPAPFMRWLLNKDAFILTYFLNLRLRVIHATRSPSNDGCRQYAVRLGKIIVEDGIIVVERLAERD